MSRFYFQNIFLSFMVLLVFSCKSKKQKSEAAKQEIINTDIAFSEMSKKYGMKKAFIEYMSTEGVLLRPGHLPIIGANAIDFLSQINDSSFTLTWKPRAAVVASSGDLGYTYGTYTLQLPDTTSYGTYVSIWKKEKDEKWKFVLDTGNEGISN